MQRVEWDAAEARSAEEVPKALQQASQILQRRVERHQLQQRHQQDMAEAASTRTAASVGGRGGRPAEDAQTDQELEARTLGVNLESTPQEVSAAVTATGSRAEVEVVMNAMMELPSGETLSQREQGPAKSTSEPVQSMPPEVAPPVDLD